MVLIENAYNHIKSLNEHYNLLCPESRMQKHIGCKHWNKDFEFELELISWQPSNSENFLKDVSIATRQNLRLYKKQTVIIVLNNRVRIDFTYIYNVF